MSDYDNSNRLALWLNDRRKEATHAHLRGNGEAGAEMWADAWFARDLSDEDKAALMDIAKRHRAASNKPFLSISLKPKEAAPAPQSEPTAAAGGFEDDSVPF